ncbi:MAG: DUF502 domain-containing protein [Candidatus Babeliales bacterium]
MKLRLYLKKLLHGIWSVFLNGLLTILPLTITIALFHLSFSLLERWLRPIAQLRPAFLDCIPHAELILVVLLIFIIGAFVKVVILKSFVHALEGFIKKIPLIRPIYAGVQQLVHAFGSQDATSFKQVVLIEFPRQGIYSIGFLTSELPDALRPSNIPLLHVFIPTTPNPTTGFLILVPRDQITRIDLSRQEAMALIISGGIILPEKFQQ